MESEIEITGSDTKGWFEKIKDWSYENWQTILVVLIVLIVGISAYNYNQQKDSSNPTAIINDSESDENNQEDEIENKDTEENDQEAIVENKDQEEASQEDNKIAFESKEMTNENTDKENFQEVSSNLDDSGKTYTVTASIGEGITHLARKVLEEYVKETENGLNLTKEQKIYAEDYIQNRTGSEKINIGHQETFSESLIKDAISNANNLSEKSLENLKKYIK